MTRQANYSIGLTAEVLIYFDKEGRVVNWSFGLGERNINDLFNCETKDVITDLVDIRGELGNKTYDNIITYLSRLGLAEVYLADGEEPF